MLAEEEIACGTRTQRGLPGASLSADLDHCRRILLSGQSVPFCLEAQGGRESPTQSWSCWDLGHWDPRGPTCQPSSPSVNSKAAHTSHFKVSLGSSSLCAFLPTPSRFSSVRWDGPIPLRNSTLKRASSLPSSKGLPVNSDIAVM